MTLTAIDQSHELFNPSALIDQGVDEFEVIDRMRKKTQEGLYCPHCFRKTSQLVPVRFRNPKERRKHFIHPNTGSDNRCVNYSEESDFHFDAKTAIAEALRLKTQTKAVVTVEEVLREGDTKRRPDVLVEYAVGAKEAHEIQISYINSTQLEDRTNDLKKLGCVVTWYLSRKNYNQENREWLRGHGVTCYHIWRNGDEIKWKLDEDREKPEKKRINSERVDTCHFSADREVIPSDVQAESIRPEHRLFVPEPLPDPTSPNPTPEPPQYIDPVYYPGRWVRYNARILMVSACDGNRVLLTANQGPYQCRYGPSPEDWNFQETTTKNLFLRPL